MGVFQVGGQEFSSSKLSGAQRYTCGLVAQNWTTEPTEVRNIMSAKSVKL